MSTAVIYDTRSDWGAVRARDASPFYRLDGITLHWAGAYLGITHHAECLARVKAWQGMHMRPGGLGSRSGASDIAYNLGACEHGHVIEMRGPKNASGANGTGDANRRYASIVYIGGIGDGITDAGWNAVRFAADLLVRAGFPRHGYGHRDFVDTECPGILYAKLPDLFGYAKPQPTLKEQLMIAIEPVAAVTSLSPLAGGWLFGRQGHVYAFENAKYFGGWGPNDPGPTNRSGRDCVALVSTETGEGYWLVSDAGEVYAYGDAWGVQNYKAEWGEGAIVGAYSGRNGPVLIRDDGENLYLYRLTA